MPLSKFAVAAVIVTLCVSANAAEEANSDRNQKVRSEYKDSEQTPSELIFASTLRYVGRKESQDHDIAVQIIQSRLGLPSRDIAEEFLAKMLSAESSLSRELNLLRRKTLCSPDLDRNPKSIYKRMDGLDDANEAKKREMYEKFLLTLDDPIRAKFEEWLQYSKTSFYYRTAEHESLYEGQGYDVVSHVDQLCEKLEVD